MISVSVNSIGVVSASLLNADGTTHRVSLSPGSPIDGLPTEVQEAALAAWTPEVVQAFADSQDADGTAGVPFSVSARQIRLWLVGNGVSLSAVDSAIDAIPDQQQRDLVRVEWEYAPWIERSHPMLAPLASALGMTAEQVDAAFIEAAAL